MNDAFLNGMRMMMALMVGWVGMGCSDVQVEPTGGGGQGGSYEPFPESCEPTAVAPACDQEAPNCGNGKIDACEVCWSMDGQPLQCADVSEECDGQAAQTCEQLGYRGGRTLCSPECNHDVRDCDSCASAPNVTCVRPRVDSYRALDLELAASGDRVAAAWYGAAQEIHVAVFDQDLELVGEGLGCDGLRGVAVELAPTPTGWLLATKQFAPDPQVSLYRLDRDGKNLGLARTLPSADLLQLVSRPSGGPLLVYASGQINGGTQDVFAVQLDESGGAVWSTPVATGAFAELTAAAFADPGWLVSVRQIEGMTSTMRVVPIDAQGVRGTSGAKGDIVEVALAPAGTGQVVAMWRSNDRQAFELQWLDGAGVDIGGLVTLAPKDETTAQQDHAVQFTNGRAIVVLAQDMRKELTVFHVEPSGAMTLVPHTLAYEPAEAANLASTIMGADPLFAWTSFAPDVAKSRFVLGRVTP